MKKIYRSEKNKIFAGIFGGIGEYLNTDPALFRVLAIFLGILSGVFPFILAYILACLVIPRKKEEKENENLSSNSVYKKWWFWLIIVIALFPIFLMIFGFIFFAKRTSFVTDNINFREKSQMIEYPENRINDIKILY